MRLWLFYARIRDSQLCSREQLRNEIVQLLFSREWNCGPSSKPTDKNYDQTAAWVQLPAIFQPRMTRMNTDKRRFTPPMASPCPRALRRSVILPVPHSQRYPERPSTPLLAIFQQGGGQAAQPVNPAEKAG